MTNDDTERRRHVQSRQIEHVGVSMWTATEAFVRAMFERVQDKGFDDISEGDADLLPHLDIDGTSLSALAARRGVTRQAAHQSVHSLIRRGYLRMDPDPEDGRSKIVRFTEKGLDFIEALQEIKADLHGEIRRTLGARDLLRLEELLRRVSKHLDASSLHEDNS